jgi:nucleotide-binding universal stress UspA family protein
MKILLAVDHSKYSEAAVHALIEQVRSEGTEVAVLHVMEVSLADFESRENFETTRTARLQQANELVERFVAELKEAGYAAKPVVEEGDAKESIISFAEHWKPDVIFVGSHGKRRFRRLTLGSVSEAVARHAPCSVQIVRVPENR